MAEQEVGLLPPFMMWAIIIIVAIFIAVIIIYLITSGSAPVLQDLIGSGEKFEPKWP